MDVLAGPPGFFEHAVEAPGGHRDVVNVIAQPRRRLGEMVDQRRQTRAIDDMQRDRVAVLLGDGRFDEQVAGPLLPLQLCVLRVRFDRDTAPAPIVEGSADGVRRRIVGADIDVPPVEDAL